jgi:hypothetical protein
MAERQDFIIYKGETFLFELPALGDDLTGYSARIQFRPNVKRLEDVVLHEVTTISLGADGVISGRVEASESSLFDFEMAVYDVALTDLAGDISYPFRGLVVIRG